MNNLWIDQVGNYHFGKGHPMRVGVFYFRFAVDFKSVSSIAPSMSNGTYDDQSVWIGV